MKKRFLAFIAALFVAGSASVFAVGLGVQTGCNLGSWNPGFAITFAPDQTWHFAGMFHIWSGNSEYYTTDSNGNVVKKSNGQFDFDLTADKWLYNSNIIGPLNWYIGIGGYVDFGFGNYTWFSGGVRVPIGLNAFFAGNVLEPYLEIAPSLGLGFHNGGLSFPDWGFPVNLGIRIWF